MIIDDEEQKNNLIAKNNVENQKQGNKKRIH